MQVQQIKPFNELSEFQQRIITFLTAANPDVGVAKMLFLGYLRKQRNDPDFLSEIEGWNEEEAEKGGIETTGVSNCFERLNQEEQKFINDIFELGGNFSEFSKKAAALVDSDGRNKPCFFIAPLWTRYMDGGFYGCLEELMKLYKYPIFTMLNNPVLVKIDFPHSFINPPVITNVDIHQLAYCVNIASKEHPNTHFKWLCSVQNISDFIKNRFAGFYTGADAPVVNIVISNTFYLNRFYEMLYELFDFHPGGNYLLTEGKFIPKPAYYSIKDGFEFYKINFVIEKDYFDSTSDADFQKDTNEKMQKIAQDLHFKERKITYQILT